MHGASPMVAILLTAERRCDENEVGTLARVHIIGIVRILCQINGNRRHSRLVETSALCLPSGWRFRPPSGEKAFSSYTRLGIREKKTQKLYEKLFLTDTTLSYDNLHTRSEE